MIEKTLDDVRQLVSGGKRFVLQGFRPDITISERFRDYEKVHEDTLVSISRHFKDDVNEIIIRT